MAPVGTPGSTPIGAVRGAMTGRGILRPAVIGLLLSLLAAAPLAAIDPPLQADRIVVLKGERKLLLMREGAVLAWFWIALGRNPTGQKMEAGDGRTPEGVYRIESRDSESEFYRALRISYPDAADRERARRHGVDPGGNIRIHAVPPGFEPTGPGERMIDWTDGCIAVTNADMDQIWARVGDGTPIEIRP
jgi:murein L,D-transpeptidase YafK